MLEKILNIHFTKKDLLYIACIVLSSLVYSFGMRSFVRQGNLFPAGYAGISRLISLLLKDFFHISISFSILYWALNALTTVYVWKRIGHKFVIYSVLWFTMTSIFTGILPSFQITGNEVLLSVFGGVINGIAIGLALRSNASSGGTDFIAIDLAIKLNRPTWNYMFAINAVVLFVAGTVYGWDQALFSIIFQFTSTEVVNKLHQRYKLTRLQIVTDHAEEISNAIFSHVRHGITKIPCEGEFSHIKHDMLMLTVNTFQINEIIQIVKSVDPKAFISVTNVEKIIGNYYQKPLE